MGYAWIDYDYETEADKPQEVLEIQERFESAQEFFIALYDELSSNEPLNLSAVYSHMSEIAGYLNVDERQFGDLTISRESKIIQFAGV